ncbi:rRNA small subunit methyltransferase I [Prochlorococcus marinus str. MIT 9107]|uniref:rRNA small subunit methyltransferase I n=2 Tax=Prochlorococcaceae TaxID=2881426 RepID=A0A0A1ZWV2_PROMR|nr:rRNA small subunit methyltransferase I [Prochlorococcus marinus str. MIT 9107]KGF93031.1 rRNA small subunit methyltransferase I [Prochlorococcus marinus str. MIT 9116]
MSRYEFTNNLISFNEHNSFKKIPKLIDNLKSGKSIALVSDAGMPSICDPGENLIKAVRNLGLNITCIPGPSAPITALASSGFPSSKFTFEGFLPKKSSERKKILLNISKNQKTTILFESPNRLKRLLSELKEYCGGDREIQVSRELTKKFEEHIGYSINDAIDFFEKEEVLGEITLVIKGTSQNPKDFEFDYIELREELHNLINAGLSLSAASKYLAKKNKLTKRLIYNMF